jgi:hypothetical protein
MACPEYARICALHDLGVTNQQPFMIKLDSEIFVSIFQNQRSELYQDLFRENELQKHFKNMVIVIVSLFENKADRVVSPVSVLKMFDR